MARTLLIIAELEGADSTQVGLLDVFGIGIMNHRQGESRALIARFNDVEGAGRG